MNLALLLEMVAQGAGDRILLGPRPGGITADDLLARTQGARALVAASDAANVAFVDVSSEALPIACFGAALAGRPFAPVSYRLDDASLGAILARLAPALAVVGADVAERIAGIGPIDGIELIETDALLETTAGHSGTAGGSESGAGPDDIAVLIFTSGTTGEPKAAVLRHRHLTSYVVRTVGFLAAGEDDAQLVSVPPYHVAGIMAILSACYAGRRIVYQPVFDPDAWVQTVVDEQITQAMVVPTMLGRILDVVEARGIELASLRHVSYGGGRMPLEVIERALDVMGGVDFVNAYGCTETSSTISILGPDEHRVAWRSTDPAVRERLRSVGRPLPGVELEVRGPDGAALDRRERGEVWVRGEQVAGEYLDRGTPRDDGWFPTRDLGWLDDDGFLYLEGRLDDVIVRGAENLSPAEIEAVLCEHPAVADAAVVGIPDAQWGEMVGAAVVLDADAPAVSADDLRAFVRARLRSTKTPAVVTFEAELPYSETGKLLRRVVRDSLRGRSDPTA